VNQKFTDLTSAYNEDLRLALGYIDLALSQREPKFITDENGSTRAVAYRVLFEEETTFQPVDSRPSDIVAANAHAAARELYERGKSLAEVLKQLRSLQPDEQRPKLWALLPHYQPIIPGLLEQFGISLQVELAHAQTWVGTNVNDVPAEASLSVNERMILLLQKTPDAIKWSARQFADHFGVSKGTIGRTKAWLSVMSTRETEMQDRMDRQRNK
jgi:hypothetical protein